MPVLFSWFRIGFEEFLRRLPVGNNGVTFFGEERLAFTPLRLFLQGLTGLTKSQFINPRSPLAQM